MKEGTHRMMTKHYKVAGHAFTVSGRAELFEQMENYEPFECEGGEPLFSLTADCGVVPEYTEVMNHGDRFLILPAINEDLYPLII